MSPSLKMKSFSLDRTVVLIKISQALNKLQEHRVHQLSTPHKINKDILKDFERREKKIKVITEDKKTYMTHIVGFNHTELILRLPDSLKIHLSKHLLLIFPVDDKEYVVQGFVKKCFLPMVVLSYADPRLGKRWKPRTEETAFFCPVSEQTIDTLIKEKLQLVRLIERIDPAVSRPELNPLIEEDSGEQPQTWDSPPLKNKPVLFAKKEEEQGAFLTIEDRFCTDAIVDTVDPAAVNDADVLVFDYEEAEHVQTPLRQNKMAGRIYDLSPSGIAVVTEKDVKVNPVDGLVYLELPLFRVKDPSAPFLEFRVRIFGIVRYQRTFGKEDLQICGIKFVKSVNDVRFFDLLEKIGEATG